MKLQILNSFVPDAFHPSSVRISCSLHAQRIVNISLWGTERNKALFLLHKRPTPRLIACSWLQAAITAGVLRFSVHRVTTALNGRFASCLLLTERRNTVCFCSLSPRNRLQGNKIKSGVRIVRGCGPHFMTLNCM